MKNETRLMNCPFCSGGNIKNTYVDWTPAIRCFDCGAVMTIQMDFEGNKELELKKRWNIRKPMERILERLEETYDVTHENYMKDRNLITLGRKYGLEYAIEIVKEEGGIRNE